MVASSITKSGSMIEGNVKEIVTVKVDPGYGPSPGNTGAGTVVAVICQAENPGGSKLPLRKHRAR